MANCKIHNLFKNIIIATLQRDVYALCSKIAVTERRYIATGISEGEKKAGRSLAKKGY